MKILSSILLFFLSAFFEICLSCPATIITGVKKYSSWACKFKIKKNYKGIECKWAFDPEDSNQADAIIPEEGFNLFGVELSSLNQDDDDFREDLLQCFSCTTSENSTDPYDPCFVDQSNAIALDCPDLSYTSCFIADSTTEIDGETFYFMERGCSKDPVGVVTGIDDTGDTPDGRIIGMDATYTVCNSTACNNKSGFLTEKSRPELSFDSSVGSYIHVAHAQFIPPGGELNAVNQDSSALTFIAASTLYCLSLL